MKFDTWKSKFDHGFDVFCKNRFQQPSINIYGFITFLYIGVSGS